MLMYLEVAYWFKLIVIFNKLKVKQFYVTGDSTDPTTHKNGKHIWNKINLNGMYYNIDFTYICNCDLETINYSCKCYYLRHPFNSFFQIDLFIKIGSISMSFSTIIV